MPTITRKRALLIGAGVLVLAAMVYAFLPDPVPVQTAAASTGPLQVIVEEEGETQVENHYIVTSPVAAYARRIELEEGDPIEAGQALVRLEPPRAAIMDPRTRSEAASRVAAARAAVSEAEVVAAQATSELERVERLHEAGAATRQTLEQTMAQAARAVAARDAARAELSAAQAAQRSAAGEPALPVEDVLRAPAAGRVLTIHRRSAGHVSPGEPLMEVGDTDRLEVAADVLSQDAVRIRPGATVLLDQWGGGGEPPLEAVVTRVEPQGFTQVSALGVEERRVRVLADITSPPAAYQGLGPGYRVLARFIIWEAPNALRVPTAALFRHDDGWAVFVVEGSRARLRPVTVGREAGLAAQIMDGLQEGEIVIVHPGNELEDGVRVTPDRR